MRGAGGCGPFKISFGGRYAARHCFSHLIIFWNKNEEKNEKKMKKKKRRKKKKKKLIF